MSKHQPIMVGGAKRSRYGDDIAHPSPFPNGHETFISRVAEPFGKQAAIFHSALRHTQAKRPGHDLVFLLGKIIGGKMFAYKEVLPRDHVS